MFSGKGAMHLRRKEPGIHFLSFFMGLFLSEMEKMFGNFDFCAGSFVSTKGKRFQKDELNRFLGFGFRFELKGKKFQMSFFGEV